MRFQRLLVLLDGDNVRLGDVANPDLTRRLVRVGLVFDKIKQVFNAQ